MSISDYFIFLFCVLKSTNCILYTFIFYNIKYYLVYEYIFIYTYYANYMYKSHSLLKRIIFQVFRIVIYYQRDFTCVEFNVYTSSVIFLKLIFFIHLLCKLIYQIY